MVKFSTKAVTSPTAGSNNNLEIFIPLGSTLRNTSAHSASDFLMDSSLRIIILFFTEFTMFEMMLLFRIKYAGLVENKAILGPSYSIRVSPDSDGNVFNIFTMKF